MSLEPIKKPIEGALFEMSLELEQACRHLTELEQPTAIYHVNALSGDGIYESFKHFTA